MHGALHSCCVLQEWQSWTAINGNKHGIKSCSTVRKNPLASVKLFLIRPVFCSWFLKAFPSVACNLWYFTSAPSAPRFRVSLSFGRRSKPRKIKSQMIREKRAERREMMRAHRAGSRGSGCRDTIKMRGVRGAHAWRWHRRVVKRRGSALV